MWCTGVFHPGISIFSRLFQTTGWIAALSDIFGNQSTNQMNQSYQSIKSTNQINQSNQPIRSTNQINQSIDSMSTWPSSVPAGPIPATLGKLTGLSYLDLGSNQFTGKRHPPSLHLYMYTPSIEICHLYTRCMKTKISETSQALCVYSRILPYFGVVTVRGNS